MAAVAPAAMVNGGQDSDKEPNVDQSPSRFTAVNGRESLAPGASASVPAPNPSASSEGHREWNTNWGKGGHDEQSRQDKRPQEIGGVGNDQEDRRSQESPSQYAPSSISRSKRRRSDSGERQEPSQGLYQGAGVSRSSVPRLEDSVDSHALPPNSNNATEPRNTSPVAHHRPETTEGPRTPSTSGPWNDYDSQLINQAQRAQQIDPSDAQLAEALQCEAQSHDAGPKGWGTVSRPMESGVHSEQPSPLPDYSQDRSQAAVQVGPKRKRVFSNRTKTGCMTCRRRKKKCDEQHPACNNCIRGGFLCEGYSSRGTWQKPSSVKTPVPLQSKDGYSDVGNHYMHEMSPYDRQQGLADQLEAGKLRPIVVDDGDRGVAQYSTSPTGVSSGRGSWSKRTWPSTAHSSYVPEHVAKADYREVPPIHELSRDEPPKSDYQVVPSIRELSQGAHSKPGVPIFQGAIDQRPVPTSSMDTSSPQAQARMALSIEHQLSARTVSGEETEKEKMIRGELYRPFDIHLVEERDRCKAALWRFNNSCNAISGLSAKEQNRLLKEVLVPPQNWNANSPSATAAAATPRSAGSIGQGAVVEAPFHCHYGYNIHISEDVMISEGCLFVDDCCIDIGAHTWIGPRVTILSSVAHANMQERKGTQSRYQGRPVTIEEDCYVGSGCTIYPGVRLRRGAYVAPGEVVKTDIVAYGFQGLKPSYM